MIRPAELSDAAAIQEINATALGYDFGLIETRLMPPISPTTAPMA